MQRASVLAALTGLFLSLPNASRGQAPAKLEFEVASVRPAAPRVAGEIMGMRGGPGSTDPGRINFRNATLQNLLLRAYNLEPDRLSGPGWLPDASFDIVATLPPGTTMEQLGVMLQNLLVDRFKVASHLEAKKFAVYEITVAKNGLKMKASNAVPMPPPSERTLAEADPAALLAQIQQLQARAQAAPAGFDADGFPSLAEGNTPAVRGMTVNGRMMVTARGQNMAGVARTLQNGLGAGVRVVDKTGLTGLYDFRLQYARAGGRAAPQAQAAPQGAFGADDPAPDVPEAAQSQLGLRLEKGTASLDVLVIDRIEKTPTEN